MGVWWGDREDDYGAKVDRAKLGLEELLYEAGTDSQAKLREARDVIAALARLRKLHDRRSMIRTGGNAKVRWHGRWSDWMRECEPDWTPPPMTAIDTPNFDKASLEEEAVCDALAAAYGDEAEEEAVCDALAAAYWEEADGGLGEATRKKARTASATLPGRVRGATPAGGGGGSRRGGSRR